MRILWRAFTSSSHAGHYFFCVFVDFDSNKIFLNAYFEQKLYTDSNKASYKMPIFS